jgi:hypothetical protein
MTAKDSGRKLSRVVFESFHYLSYDQEKAMFWIAFFSGILVGTIVGVFAVAMCQMASRGREHRAPSCEPECQCYSFGPPVLLRKTE